MAQGRDWAARIWRPENGRQIWKMPLIKDGGQNWFPGVHSASNEDSNFRRKLVSLLNETVPCDNNEETAEPGPNFVHTAWDRLKTKPGFDQTPITLVERSNKDIITELELPLKPRSDRDVAIFKKGFRLFLEGWVEGSFRAKNNSSAGFPTFVTNGFKKKEIAESLLADGKYQKVLACVGKDDLNGLAKDHDVFVVYKNQARRQVDVPTKVRKVLTEDALRTGGSRTPAEKRIKLNGALQDEFTRMRARPVQGLSWSVNAYIQAAASGHMRYIFNAYPYTFKSTTTEQVCEKLDETFAELEPLYGEVDTTFSDVSNYDSTIRDWMFDLFWEVLAEFYDGNFVKLNRWAQQAPYFMPGFSVDVETGERSTRGIWVGNPMDLSTFIIQAGLRSGIGWVSFIGKVVKFLESACVWDAVTGDVLEDLRNYALGVRAIRQINSGDDTVDVGAKTITDKCMELRLANKAGYFKIEREMGQGYIGGLYKRENGKWIAHNRIVTYLEKWVCNEHDINHAFRAHWPMGYYERPLFYGNCPAYEAVNWCLNEAYRTELEPTVGSLGGVVARAHKEMLRSNAQIHARTFEDLALMLNPDRIHFSSIDESKISPEVMDTISTRIDDAITFNFIKGVYGGTIH